MVACPGPASRAYGLVPPTIPYEQRPTGQQYHADSEAIVPPDSAAYVCTKADDVSPEEVRRDHNLPPNTTRLECALKCNEVVKERMHKTVGVLTSHLGGRLGTDSIF